MAINLGTIFAQIGLDTSLLRAGVSKANTQFKRADKSIGGFIKRNETKLLGFGAAGAAAVAAIGIASIKMAGDFDQAMRNVNTITKLSEEQFLALKEEVIDLSKEVPLTTQELTDGLFNVASAGVQAADQMNFLATASRAAVAGQANLGITVKGITGVIKGYGDEFANADKVADLFFKTNELGVTTFEELASSMGKVVPIASALGVTQEELFASMATLTGVTGNTSEVVTQLKAAFTNLIKPSKEAQEIAQELGISFNATSIETLGLAGFLDQIRVATGGNVETMGKLFGSVEGLNAILALTGSSAEKFESNLMAMADAGGAATDAFSEQQKGLNNQLKILKNNVNAIALDIGGKIIPALTDFTKRINELDDDTKDNISNVAQWSLGIAGVVSVTALLTGGISKLLGFLGPYGKAILVVVGALTTHFKITQKLSDLIKNEWTKNVLESISLIGSFKSSINVWSEATRFAEENNESLIRTLFRLRSTIEESNIETDEAISKTNDFTGSLLAEKIEMQKSAEGLRIRTIRQSELNNSIDDSIPKVDALGNEINSLEGDASAATQAIVLLSGAILNIPTPKSISVGPTIITGGISAGGAIRTPSTVVAPISGGQVTSTTTTTTTQTVSRPRFRRLPSGAIVGFADGGITPFAGQFLVGEKGPEIATLPQGTQITPNNKIDQQGGGSREEIIIPVTVELDGEVLFESIERSSNREEFRRIN